LLERLAHNAEPDADRAPKPPNTPSVVNQRSSS
jgi:hypothetical protein